MEFEITGLLGVVLLIADIWAILNVVESAASTLAKTLWIVLILLLQPAIGLLIWFFFGPRKVEAA